MPEQGSPKPSERSSTTGPRPDSPISAPAAESADPPTVIRSSGQDSGRRNTAGSSLKTPSGGAGIGSGSAPRRTGEGPVLPRAGDFIATFKLEESIGVGGMGAVYRATDTVLDRQVALKLLPPDMANDPEAVPRFYQEGRAAARLDHENIARVFSIGHDGPIHYIAFEYIQGTTIRQKVEREGILPVSTAIEITLQVAEALVHSSARGVVHRDVKPSNIIITPDGRAKLVDMGLARRFERGGDNGLTQTGMTLGTFDYISPEQARDPRDVDVRGDLYSLGCTLFFMLSGRPPFPDGTVLQKLIKHQEEPTPDIRAVNPSVPAELASVLAKLMDKDRERRYQTPDQLVRDLMNVALVLGLQPNFTTGAHRPAATPPPAWERHLIWAIPTVACVLLIATLIYVNSTATTDPRPPGIALSDGGPRLKEFSKPAITAAPKKDGGAEPTRPSTPTLPREISVNAGDDLFKIMTEAPPRSTILLTDEGPYTIRRGPRGEGTRLTGLDLTIRSDLGLRPVIRLARGNGEDQTGGAALFDLKGGRLTLEDLELVIDTIDREEPTVAIQAEDVDLTVSRCMIRRSGIGSKDAGRGIAVRVKTSVRGPNESERRPTSTLLDACHVDAGLTAIAADGPVELSIRDTTLGAAASGPTFDLRNADGNPPSVVHLRHISALVGSAPLFTCGGVAPRIRVSDSVFSPSGDIKGTLIEADDPSRLDWRGTDNLYGRIGVFLQAKRGTAGARVVCSSLAAWADDSAAPREFGSLSVVTRVWDHADPASALGTESQDPSRLFKLAEARSGMTGLGARQGPNGPLPIPSKLATVPSRELSKAPEAVSAPIPGGLNSLLVPGPEFSLRPMPKNEAEKNTVDRPPSQPTNENDPAAEEMPEMPVMPPPGGASPPKSEREPAPTSPMSTVDSSAPKTAGLAEPNESPLIKTAAQFLEAIRGFSTKGGTLRLVADADWELPASEINGGGSWTIKAEQGTTRPRVRFRPASLDASVKGPTKPAWLTIPNGSLKLEGVDVVVPPALEPNSPGRAAFAIGLGADLILSGCTVTLEGDQPESSALRVVTDRTRSTNDEAQRSAPTIRLKNCLVRSGGDMMDVPSGQPLDLELENVVVATAGSLLHGHGASKSAAARILKLTLRQVSAKSAGGLLRLESTPESPALPQADIVARDTLLATTAAGDPLVRLESQSDDESVSTRVRWDGQNVAYHRIGTYRRDQFGKTGSSPKLFDRTTWETTLGRREASPIHDDLKFVNEWGDDRQPWELQPDDFQLGPDSPAAKSGAGSDLIHVPSAPDESD